MTLVVINAVFAVMNLYFAFIIQGPQSLVSLFIGLLNLSVAYILYNKVSQSKD